METFRAIGIGGSSRDSRRSCPRILGALDDESKARVWATKKDQLAEKHPDWGMGIRNSLGLWRGNEKLLESCGQGRKIHPDECSMVIIEAVWTLLQAPEPEAHAR